MLITPNKACILEEQCLAIWRKLSSFWELQHVYMPRALCAMKQEEQCTSLDLSPPEAKQVKLWLPLELTTTECVTGCTPSLPLMEKGLHKAECHETLEHICNWLHAKKHLMDDQIYHATDQHKGTKLSTIIGKVIKGINLLAAKYWHACLALWALGREEEHSDVFKDLRPEHLMLDYKEEEDDDSLWWMAWAGSDGGLW